MALWNIEPSWKKSIIERQEWIKDGQKFIYETGWRWGTFQTETEDDNPPNIQAGDDLWCCGYDVELIETWDGCWDDYDYDGCDDETREWLEEFFEEGNSVFDLEEHGWTNGDTEMIIDCDPIFERVDGPDAGKKYDSDGDEIPSEDDEKPREQPEAVKLNADAAWPFPNATEVTEYAQFKCTSCDYSTDDINDLVENDESGEFLCPECNSKVDLE